VKKIILSVIVALSMLIMTPVANAEEKVPVYMFTKEGCPACISAIEYFDGLAKDYPDVFELYEIEVFDKNWQATSNNLQSLLIKTYEAFGEDSSSAATPTIVIGNYHTIGLPQDTSLVEDAILAVRDSEEKVDKVKDLADDLDVNLAEFKLGDEQASGKYDTLIIVGIFVVLIGGFAGLVIAGKKQ